MKAKTKLIIGIVLAVVILAVGLTVTLVVTGNLERDQQQVVRSASQIETAMSTDLGGKTIVLAEDITVEGDLEMSRLANLDLNGHTLTVTGTFSVESDSAAEIEIKSTDGDKAVSGGTIDAGSVDINVPKAHVEWSADVRLGSDGTFSVLTSGDSFSPAASSRREPPPRPNRRSPRSAAESIFLRRPPTWTIKSIFLPPLPTFASTAACLRRVPSRLSHPRA